MVKSSFLQTEQTFCPTKLWEDYIALVLLSKCLDDSEEASKSTVESHASYLIGLFCVRHPLLKQKIEKLLETLQYPTMSYKKDKV